MRILIFTIFIVMFEAIYAQALAPKYLHLLSITKYSKNVDSTKLKIIRKLAYNPIYDKEGFVQGFIYAGKRTNKFRKPLPVKVPYNWDDDREREGLRDSLFNTGWALFFSDTLRSSIINYLHERLCAGYQIEFINIPSKLIKNIEFYNKWLIIDTISKEVYSTQNPINTTRNNIPNPLASSGTIIRSNIDMAIVKRNTGFSGPCVGYTVTIVTHDGYILKGTVAPTSSQSYKEQPKFKIILKNDENSLVREGDKVFWW